MIPAADIVAWSRIVGWPTGDQVEQDLLLSRLIVEIANDEYLGGELVFRGGTCLHKVCLPFPWRYSEDLDYVRRSGGGIAELTRALTRVGERLEMEVRTRISQHPKVFFRAPFESASGPMKIKVEVNTFERSPARTPELVRFAVDTSWFTGAAMVSTFTAAEMLATKIRALFQRSRPRFVRPVAGPHRAPGRPCGDPRLPRAVSTGRLHGETRNLESRSEARRRGVPPRSGTACLDLARRVLRAGGRRADRRDARQSLVTSLDRHGHGVSYARM